MKVKNRFSVGRLEKIGIFLGFLVFSASAAFVFLPTLGLNATDVTQEVGDYVLTMSMNSDVTINVTPTSSQASYSAANNLSVSNICPYGMIIALTTNSNSNALVNSAMSSKTIPATTGTTLGNNTWGFSKDGGETWSAVPAKNGTAATIYSSSSAQTTAYTVPISFGVRVDSSIASGAYSTDVLYSMTPNSNCAAYNITWDFNGGSGKSGATYPTKMNNGQTIDLSAIKPTKTYYDFAGWTNGTNTFSASAGVTDINPDSNNDITMTAQWTPTKYSITYDFDGGSCSNPKNDYTYETATFSLCTPTRTGYTFTGWTGSNGTTAQTSVSIPKNSSGNKSYTAHWTPTNYSITYTWNGGSCSSYKDSYNIETTTFSLCTPTRTGYTFTGWTGSNGTTAQKTVTINSGSTGNKSYTANWSINSYTVSVTNGHFSDGTTSKSFNYNSTASATANSCSSTGFQTSSTDTQTNRTTCYSTTGTSSGATTKSITVTGTSTITFTGYTSSTLYRYLVRFKDSKDTSTEYSNTWTNSNGNGGFSFPSAPSKTGYTFQGWNTSSTATTGTTASSGTVSAPTTYYAIWSATKYTITYDLNCTGASVATTNPPEYYITSAAITLNNPTCPGHTFNGWTGSNGTTAQKTVTIPNGSTGNKSYTASWSINSYTVDVVNGHFSDGTTSKSFTYNSTASATANSCSSTGFQTYSTDTQYNRTTCYSTTGTSSGATTKSITVTGASTITFSSYTSSTLYRYVVRFKDSKNTSYEYSNTWTNSNGNGGFSFPSNPTKSGYTFKGWNTSSIATTGTTASSGTVSAPTTYYAIWSVDKYSINITLNCTGASVSPTNPPEYSVESAAITLNNPTCPGHTFTGWTGSNGTTPQTTVTIPSGSTGIKNYTANWKINSYTVTVTNGKFSDGTTSKSFTYNSTATATRNNSALPGCTDYNSWSTYATDTQYRYKTCYAWNDSTTTKSITVTGNATISFGYYSYSSDTQYRYAQKFYSDGSLYTTVWTDSTGYFVAPSAPSKTGYTFGGWDDPNDNYAAYTANAGYSRTEPGSYNAVWTAIKYTISYDLNCTDATVSPANPGSYYITSSAITLNNPTCPGHTFNGWTGSNGTTPQTSVSIAKGSTGNKSYTANWTTNRYTITVNNGTGGGTYDYGTRVTITANSDPATTTSDYNFTQPCGSGTYNMQRYKTQTSHPFTGWSGNSTSTSRSFTITVTGNATYTANYGTSTSQVDTQTCKTKNLSSVSGTYKGNGKTYDATVSQGGSTTVGNNGNTTISFSGTTVTVSHDGNALSSSSDITVKYTIPYSDPCNAYTGSGANISCFAVTVFYENQYVVPVGKKKWSFNVTGVTGYEWQ